MRTTTSATPKPRRGSRIATLMEMAREDFEALPRAKGDKPLTADAWGDLRDPHGASLRFAWEICHKSKPELVEAARKMNDETGRAFMVSYISSIEFFERALKLLEAGEARFLTALSIVELEKEGAS